MQPGTATPHAVQVVAHRGAADGVAEHTLEAYERAIADGVDAVECDVRLTADCVPVCVHDRRIQGLPHGDGLVSALQLGEPDRDRGGVLTLARLLELVASVDRRVEVAIETKHPTRFAGLVERRLVEVLDRFGWASPPSARHSPVRVMSFSRLSLRRMRQLAPAVPAVFLRERPSWLRGGANVPTGVQIAGPSIDLVRARPDLVGRLHARGIGVHVWPVDRPDDVELCWRLGVDAVITDTPRQVLGRLGRPDGSCSASACTCTVSGSPPPGI
ncbi:MAG: glycerophosphodiester phosphodiesterase [Carbonactinosporaceae bacterium]